MAKKGAPPIEWKAGSEPLFAGSYFCRIERRDGKIAYEVHWWTDVEWHLLGQAWRVTHFVPVTPPEGLRE